MKTKLSEYGKTALITGASSGIGEAFAKRLAQAGMDLVLVARREDRLRTLAHELSKQFNIRAQYIVADLRDPKSIVRLAEETESRNLSVDLLVNNAGYGLLGSFGDNDHDGELGMIDLNCRAVVDVTLRFLPGMKVRKRGAIIIVSSVAGALPVPWFSTYASTKSFDLYFGEALHAELQGTGIEVLTVLPGLTATEFQAVSGALSKRDYSGSSRTSDQVVESAFNALGKKAIVVDGIVNKVLVHGTRLLPRALVLWMSRWVMAREMRMK